MDARRGGTGSWLYLLAAALVIAGVLIFVDLLVLPFTGMQRVAMPGTQQLTLTRSGTYTVVYEYQGSLSGVAYDAARDEPGLRITVVDAATGQPVALTGVSHNLGRYSLGSRGGYSVARFTVDQPGTYAISAAYSTGQTGPTFALGLVHATLGSLVGDLVVGVAALVLGLASGVLVALVAIVKRLAARPPRSTREPTPAD